jgi:hypothetical protein
MLQRFSRAVISGTDVAYLIKRQQEAGKAEKEEV